MIKPKKILIFSDWYEPGYRAGGPIRSVANLVKKLPHQFSVITRNNDYDNDEPYQDIKAGVWVRKNENTRIIYLDPVRRRIKTYRKILKADRYDFIYLNSLFSYQFTLLPLLAANKQRNQGRIILAPRGMLKQGALSIKSHKKKLFLFLARLFGLYNGVIWHATSEHEKKEILATFGNKAKVRVAPNLVSDETPLIKKEAKKSGVLRLVSVARISPEKNIHESLRFLQDTLHKGRIEYHIYGATADPEYLNTCKEIAAALPHVDVIFQGPLPHYMVSETISRYDFFYLPTLGENYGHAIVESLLTGTPVIISDRTPWKNLERRKAGWDLKLDRILFNQILNHCLLLNDNDYQNMSEGARRYGLSIAQNDETFKKNLDLFIS